MLEPGRAAGHRALTSVRHPPEHGGLVSRKSLKECVDFRGFVASYSNRWDIYCLPYLRGFGLRVLGQRPSVSFSHKFQIGSHSCLQSSVVIAPRCHYMRCVIAASCRLHFSHCAPFTGGHAPQLVPCEVSRPPPRGPRAADARPLSSDPQLS